MNTQPNVLKAVFTEDFARLGLNEAALARLVGVTQQAVSFWSNRGFPPVTRVRDIAQALGPDSAFARVPHGTWLQASADHKKRLREARESGGQTPGRADVDESPAATSAPRYGRNMAVIVEVHEPAGRPERLGSKLLGLAAKRIAQGLAAGATVALALVCDPSALDSEDETDIENASVLGVEVWRCASGLEVARRLAERQGVQLT